MYIVARYLYIRIDLSWVRCRPSIKMPNCVIITITSASLAKASPLISNQWQKSPQYVQISPCRLLSLLTKLAIVLIKKQRVTLDH